jgi:arylsulfatase A-like enzyme
MSWWVVTPFLRHASGLTPCGNIQAPPLEKFFLEKTPAISVSREIGGDSSVVSRFTPMIHHFKNPLILFPLAFFAMLLACPAQTAQPNIILILADDLGYGELGCYGGSAKTPHIDRLASQGVRCTDGYAAFPVCSPSRAALLTGRYPQRFGPTYEDYFGHGAPELDPVQHTTIAQLMKEAGYRTGCFGKWNVSNKNRTPANAFGFDTWVGLHLNHDFYTHKLVVNGEGDLFKNGEPFVRDGVWSDTVFADEAIRFIRDDDAEKPFFLFLPFQAPHDPIQDPETPHAERLSPQDPANRPTLVKMIERLDTEVGRILQALENQGVVNNTLIIFTSDNGGAKFLGRNLPLRGEKQLLLEGGIRVPMILRWPNVLPEGKTSSTPFIAMDLTATIAAASGAKPRETQPLDGIDMIPILTGKADPDADRPLFFRRRNIDVAQGRNQIQQTAIRQGDWKLLRTYKPSPNLTYQSALYHIKEDIGEATNLIAEKPEKAKKLGELLDQWENEMTETAEPYPIRNK